METAFDVSRFVWRHPANEGRRGRQLLRAVGYQARGRLLRWPTVIPIGSHSRLIAYPHSTPASKAVYANPPDWPEMIVWKYLLGSGNLFVDVGANVGTYSLWAADLGAEVIAVEPNRVAAERFRANFALNRYPVVLYEGVLAEQHGEITFDGGKDAAGHISPQGELVTALTLDEILGDRVADGVKIDVEGAERRVLEGARRALSDQRIRCLQLEWNHQSEVFFGESREPVADLLLSFGYRLLRPDWTGRLTHRVFPGYGEDVFAVVD
jgi:FkbM family methyltransferase